MSNVGTREELLKSIRNLHRHSWSQGAIPLATHPSMTSTTWTLGIMPAIQHPALRDQISDLAARAEHKNPFFDLPILEPSIRHLAKRPLQFLFLAEKTGSHEALKLFAPVQFEKTTFFRRPVIRVWSHEYAPLGHPLVDPRNLQFTFEALINCLQQPISTQPCVILIEDMPTKSTFCNQILEANILNETIQKFATYKRPALFAVDAKAYDEAHVSGKRRQRLRKAKERLSKRGQIAFSCTRTVGEVEQQLDAFLELEAKGWKGRKGTALLSTKKTADATRANVLNMAHKGRCEIHALEVNERVVASIILYQNKGNYFPWKTAYNEDFAQYSVGNLLTNHMNQMLSCRPDFIGLDSLAAQNNETAKRFWPDHLELASFAIGLGATSKAMAQNIRKELMFRHNAKQSVKSILRVS